MLLDFLKQIEDKRNDKGKSYDLGHILFFSVLAAASGADSFPKIATFIDDKFWQFDEIFNMGWTKPPTESGIRKIFYTIEPGELEKSFRKYISEVANINESKILEAFAADGKTLRGSYDHMKNQKAVQILSVFHTRLDLILAHSKIADKTNEIPVLPELIKELGLEGKIFTMDAMHCQKNT